MLVEAMKVFSVVLELESVTSYADLSAMIRLGTGGGGDVCLKKCA